jgi:hypothetical protein
MSYWMNRGNSHLAKVICSLDNFWNTQVIYLFDSVSFRGSVFFLARLYLDEINFSDQISLIIFYTKITCSPAHDSLLLWHLV